MARNNDFSNKVKKHLATVAGNRCSYPNCGIPTTSCKKSTFDNPESNTGMACHIYAASQNTSGSAKRVAPDKSPAELQSIKNGIWMCYNHGKLIDTDENRFPADMLIKWKETQQKAIQIMQSQKIEFEQAYKIALGEKAIESERYLTHNISICKDIGDQIEKSCLPIILGNESSNKLREFLTEYCLNAFNHGSAINIKVEITTCKITISDDGSEFNYSNLLEHLDSLTKGGGCLSLVELKKDENNFILNYKHEENKNILDIIFSKEIDIIKENLYPCIIEFNYNSTPYAEIKIEHNCKNIFVFMPQYTNVSMITQIGNKFHREQVSELGKDKKIIFLLNKSTTTELFQKVLRELVPNSEIRFI